MRRWPQNPPTLTLCYLSGVSSDASRWLGLQVVGPRFRGLLEPAIHHKGTNPRTGRGVSQRHPSVPSQLPNFYFSGTNPRTGHWTACLCPVKDVADVTVEPSQENQKRGKGSSVSADLWRCPGGTGSCGAAQFDPSRPPRFLCLGCFRPLATTGAIPRTGFQAPRCTVRCTVRDGAFDEHTAGRFGLERALLATLTHLLEAFVAGSEVCTRPRPTQCFSLPAPLGLFTRSPAYGLSFRYVYALFSMFLRGPHPLSSSSTRTSPSTSSRHSQESYQAEAA